MRAQGLRVAASCLVFGVVPFGLGQQPREVSLAPFREAARQALAAEQARAAAGDCKDLVQEGPLTACMAAASRLSQRHLLAMRSAIANSIRARSSLFGAGLLKDFTAAEEQWDIYANKQVEVTADMVNDVPADVPASQDAERIALIRAHMKELDRIYFTLLHDSCGACLTDR